MEQGLVVRQRDSVSLRASKSALKVIVVDVDLSRGEVAVASSLT